MKRNAYFLTVWTAAMLSLGSAIPGCTKSVRLDPEPDAIASGDVTAPLEGCGTQLQDGVLVCRKTEGDASKDQIYFVGPAADCAGSDPCVTFKVFFPDGSPAIDGAIPLGKTRQALAWTALLKRDTFEKADRGFWAYSYQIRFQGPDGRERSTFLQGFIFLVVTSQGYTSAHELPAEPNMAWSWNEGGAPIKVSTAGRVYVGRRQ
jgi:hypothetical protein